MTTNYRVPVSGYGSVIIRADSSDEAFDYARNNHINIRDTSIDTPEVDLSARGQVEPVDDDITAVNDEKNEKIDPPTFSSVGNLKATRIAYGLTQREISEWLGVSRPTVSRWERDNSNITLFQAQAYSRALGSLRHNP